MEGPGETERLRVKDDSAATLNQLIETGFAKLPASPVVVDAGSGVGVVAEQMAALIRSIYQDADLILLDGATERLEAASKNLANYGDINQRFIDCNLDNIPLASNTVDYVFCRFVFEYLQNPIKVFQELKRIVKPGGKLVIGDLDHNCLNHYPIPSGIQDRLNQLIQAVEATGFFDFYAGRKLYSYFHEAGFDEIHVHVHPHHLFYGDLKANDAINWEIKLDRLIALQKKNVMQIDFDLEEFKTEFMTFLHRPDRFSYTPLIIVEGVKS